MRFNFDRRPAGSVTAFALLLLVAAFSSRAADSGTQVQLSVANAGPRTVEPRTEQVILRDYRYAWTSLSQAVELNTTDPLEGPFTGNAKKMLADTIANQQRSGLSTRYLNQSHKVEAVFYAPEGDVIELHDTADYQFQLLDGNKQIHDDRVTAHYIVLMTPASDRWVVRQLQQVQHF